MKYKVDGQNEVGREGGGGKRRSSQEIAYPKNEANDRLLTLS